MRLSLISLIAIPMPFTEKHPISLASLKRRQSGKVLSLEGDEKMQNRLRELGLFENAQVTVLHVNGSVLCQVNDSRFGLDPKVAESVRVEPLK